MSDTRGLIMKLLVAGVLVLVLFYGLVAAPAQQEIVRQRQEVNTLEQACVRSRAALKLQPPLPEVEKALWVHLDRLLAKKLYSRGDANSAFGKVSALALRCGARTLGGEVAAPAAPAPAARGSAAPAGGRLLGEDLEDTVATRRGSSAQPGPAKAPTPELGGRPSEDEMPSAFKRLGRAAETAPAKPVTRRLGGLDVEPFSLNLTLSGPYTAWPEFFNALSWGVEPVLFQKMAARAVFVDSLDKGPQQGGGVLEVNFELPVVSQAKDAEASLSAEPPALTPSADLARTERIYLVDQFRKELPAKGPTTSRDPFPVAAAPGEAGASAAPLKPTAFMKRDGAFIALINNKWVGRGDRVGPYKILAITEDRVWYGQ